MLKWFLKKLKTNTKKNNNNKTNLEDSSMEEEEEEDLYLSHGEEIQKGHHVTLIEVQE